MSHSQHNCKHPKCDPKFAFLPKQATHPVWKFFRLQMVDSAVDTARAMCVLCHGFVAYCGSSNAFRQHLSSHHLDELLDMCPRPHVAKEQNLLSASWPTQRVKASEEKRVAVVEHLLLWAADTGVSLHAFQHEEFANAMRKLDEAFHVPAKTALKCALESLGERSKSSVRSHFFFTSLIVPKFSDFVDVGQFS